jgi:hypothetical protein
MDKRHVFHAQITLITLTGHGGNTRVRSENPRPFGKPASVRTN